MKCFVGNLLSVIVGGLMAYAGITKALAPAEFYQSVLNYQLLGADLAWAVALFLPWLEIVAGLALIAPWTRRGAVVWLVLLLLTFQAGLASAWARGLDIDCGCFGQESSSASMALIRNCFLLAAVVVVGWTERRKN
ncbi:MAG: MauE/DoxX family redox-associated membrane protein [Puniceicoccales bacterium]